MEGPDMVAGAREVIITIIMENTAATAAGVAATVARDIKEFWTLRG